MKKYQSIINHYEACYEEHGDSHLGLDWPNKKDTITRFSVMLDVILDKTNKTSLLDFGCGTGDSSIVFNIFLPKAKVFLHDFSEVAVKKGLKKYERFLNVRRADIETQKFDLVYTSNVIEHVLDPKVFVEDLIRLTKRYILIQCPYKEYHPDGKKITPQNPISEHFWTIDEEFIEKHIYVHQDFDWRHTTGVVPMAWQGGEQVFIFGKLK